MPLFLLSVPVLVTLYLTYRYYPSLGGRPNKLQKHKAAQSANHDHAKNRFINYIPTPMDMDSGAMRSMLRDQFNRSITAAAKPSKTLKLKTPSLPGGAHDEPRVTWLGHSSMLVYLAGKTILLDPMFGKAASPFSSVGPKRFKADQPYKVEDLPKVDIVCISHDHYDHLDYPTIKKLSKMVQMFFVPLGVGAHLERWGVSPSHITELDWWEERMFQGLKFACTPARHFSGRTLTDRARTLWASWVVIDTHTRLFFSGDTGYGPHFKKIGQKYGPFDLTMMECGQYDRRWPNIHMQPEQTAQAHIDVRGARLLPMHWGVFKLAFHGWSESVERLLAAAKQHGSTVVTPALGQTIAIKGALQPAVTSAWWEAYKNA